MADKLYGSLPADQRRLLFVKKRMNERGALSFAKSDEIVRTLAPVAVSAVNDFDRNEYVEGYMKWVSSEEADATQIAMMMRILDSGVERLKQWCDNHHEPPKACDCATLADVVMGFAQPVEELPEVKGD